MRHEQRGWSGTQMLRRRQRLDVVVGEGIDEHAVGDAVDRGGSADAEGKSENGGDGEAGRTAQLAKGVTQIRGNEQPWL